MSTTITLPAMLQDGIRYGTIFADPPWPERGGGKIKRGADRHYPLMKVAGIVATGEVVQQVVSPNSHLYPWATNKHLPDALEVMESWGFRYVTTITWAKEGNAGQRGSTMARVTPHWSNPMKEATPGN